MKPLPAPIWFVAAFIPMVASQVLRLRHLDAGGWLFWDYAGRLGGVAVLAAMAWPVAFRGETLRMPRMQVALEKTRQSNRIHHDRAVAETAQGANIPSK